MAFKFPFTNYHELNLTWVLDQLKKLFEESAENVSTIQNYDGRLTAVETELPTVSETASEASRSAAAAGTMAQSAKATADTAQENAVQAQSLAGTARQEAQNAQTAADAATQAAQQAQATAQNFDGRITQAENDASQALEASRSFENRVQSAITTANNAARTATDAQGVAQNANQNAAAALDKIGDLSQLTTTAKQNLVVAINEAAQSGGVTSVNGKTGAVMLDASDIGYNDSTVETALDGKQNAPTAAGAAGQVLGLNSALEPVWLNPSGGGGDCSNCAPLIINTASGDVATFTDGANNLQIRKIVGTIVPMQAGTGNPSPDNVRPFSGWTEANIYNEETYDASATPKLTINWQTEAGTVYGGTVTLNDDGSADVVSTNIIYDLSTDFTYYPDAYQSEAAIRFGRGNTNLSATPIGTVKSNVLVATTVASLGARPMYSYYYKSSNYYPAELKLPAKYNTNAKVKAFLQDVDGNGTHAMLLVNRAMPLTYHFSDIGQLFTFLGTNNVRINTGSITECLYPADTKLYIDGKIAEIQALVLENNG